MDLFFGCHLMLVKKAYMGLIAADVRINPSVP